MGAQEYNTQVQLGATCSPDYTVVPIRPVVHVEAPNPETGRVGGRSVAVPTMEEFNALLARVEVIESRLAHPSMTAL